MSTPRKTHLPAIARKSISQDLSSRLREAIAYEINFYRVAMTQEERAWLARDISNRVCALILKMTIQDIMLVTNGKKKARAK